MRKNKTGNQPDASRVTRRAFVKRSAFSSGAALLALTGEGIGGEGEKFSPLQTNSQFSKVARLPDLRPARWLWYPSERCLQNTFVLFRRELDLQSPPRRAAGWIAADSRYRLEVNGERVQWGGPPCDPRWLEADPIDLTKMLRRGANVIGAQVLNYGQGDGTSPLGKPGFLFWLEVETEDGRKQNVVSDRAWRALLARSWKPGQYKRWYLRALQEEFDARLYPYGWTTAKFDVDEDWLPALELECPADKPPLCSTYRDYQFDLTGAQQDCELRPRGVPLMKEVNVPVARLAAARSIRWRRPPEEYFECLTPNAFSVERNIRAGEGGSKGWRVDLGKNKKTAHALTFEFKEQMVGWPYFTIEAPAGTIVELMVQEGHEPDGPSPLLNTHFNSWTRFVCREGTNRFETFDFESCRWVQLHIRNEEGGEVTVRDVGMRRRVYPWPNEPNVKCSDAPLQRLLEASINTLHNCAQENLVDGMGRERQQYSGDVGHQTHAIYHAFGEQRLPARYLTTFSQGMTLDGYFLDCWPAYDRLARVMERQVGVTKWGPLLDHGVGFNFDCYYHHLYTGDKAALAEPYPRLLRFADYLKQLRRKDGLLPVEDIGVPVVWIDHDAYRKQRHKQCAFNLYAAAMFEHALAPLCRVFGDARGEAAARRLGRELLAATVRRFWNPRRKLFVNNLPWAAEEKETRLCDRSLATALLFNQNPAGNDKASLQALANNPPEMGISYPANAGWRMWALAEKGRTDAVLKELRERWTTLNSVLQNNSLQEDWTARPDSGAQWSHCPVAPLYVFYMNIAGVRPLAPGFARYEVRPQMGDLEELELTSHTVRGPVHFRASGKIGWREITITTPPGDGGELVVKREEKVDVEVSVHDEPGPLARYRLPSGGETKIILKHS